MMRQKFNRDGTPRKPHPNETARERLREDTSMIAMGACDLRLCRVLDAARAHLAKLDYNATTQRARWDAKRAADPSFSRNPKRKES